MQLFKVCNKFPGTQTPAVATTDCAVQCSLLSAPPLSFFGNSPEQPSIDDSRESDVYSDESGTEAETDIDYSTESETEVETDVDYCDTDDLLKRFTIAIINRVLTPFNIHLYCSPNSPGSNLPLHRSKKFIVFEDCLMVLFKKCQNCGDETTTTTTRVIGTFLNVIQHCSKCFFMYKWDSQPVIKDIPAGNILLSASILFSGSLPAKVYRCSEYMDVPPSAIAHTSDIKVAFSNLQYVLFGTNIKLISSSNYVGKKDHSSLVEMVGLIVLGIRQNLVLTQLWN